MVILLLCYLLSLLPLKLLYLISDLLFFILYYLVGYRKKVVIKNLINAFKTKTIQERQEITKAFYKQLADLLVEHIKALTIGPKALLQQVVVCNKKIIEEFYQQGQSIVLVSGHLGNWEWAAHALALEIPHKISAAYQPLHHKGIDRIALHLRTRFQRKAMPYNALIKHTIAHKGSPQAIVLLIDQAPLCKKNGYQTTFFGQATTVILTAAKLAKKYNQPIFYIQIMQLQRGKYQITPILLAADTTKLSAQEVAERYTRRLEENIVENLPLWLWSHRRWK